MLRGGKKEKGTLCWRGVGGTGKKLRGKLVGLYMGRRGGEVGVALISMAGKGWVLTAEIQPGAVRNQEASKFYQKFDIGEQGGRGRGFRRLGETLQ